MTAEATPQTVTVELNVEDAYRQLVAHEKAYKAFVEAEDTDVQAKLDATTDAVMAAVDLINNFIPDDLRDKLHERLEQEHPELKQPEPEFDLQALVQMLLGGDD